MKTSNWIFYPLLLILLLFSESAIAEEQERLRIDIPISSFLSDAQTSVEGIVARTTDPRYLVAPRIVPLRQVNPGTTQFPIDGIQTTRSLATNTLVGAEASKSRNSTLNVERLELGSPFFQESIDRDRVYRLEYTNSFDRIKTISQERDLIATASIPQTLLGMRTQISLVGDCRGDDNSSKKGQICVYTPGIATDNNSIDPEKLIPLRTLQSAQFGEVVSPASLAAMRQEGFQSGANGQDIGINLYFPNVGRIDNNETNSISGVERREEQIKIPALTSGGIQQVLVSNGAESGISRTTRGFTILPSDRFIVNHGVQLLSLILPSAEPRLPPGKAGQSASINPNLIMAANNARLPENSFTFYSGGWGYAQNASDSKAGTPAPASYHQIWLGLSPVIDRQVKAPSHYRTISAERIKVSGGGEGGANSGTKSILNLNDRVYSQENVGNSYSQVYLTLFERDVELLNTTRLRETTDYYPHISFSGNRTTFDSVLRYYTGAILEPRFIRGSGADRIQAYSGVDFKSPQKNGFSYNFAAIGYINPSPEYYSRISANISQKINLGSNINNNLLLTSDLNYALDGTTEFDRLKFRSGNSFVSTGLAVNLGNVSFKTTYFMPNRLPNSIDSLLSTSLAWKVKDNLSLSGYYAPIDRNSPRSTYGVSAAFKFGTEERSHSLILNWSNNSIDVGQSIRGDRLVTNEHIFGVFFNWAEPF